MKEVRDMLLVLVIAAFAAFILFSMIRPDEAEARPLGWQYSEASYYTLYGNRTACGVTMSPKAWHVASLSKEHARCGRKLTICNGSRCVRVTVQDRGAYRSDGRTWDLTPRVRDALRCGDLCMVKWRLKW